MAAAAGAPQDPQWLATTYAEALARAEFGPVAPLLETAVHLEFSAAERHRIVTIARVITVLNRSTNTVDALRARLGGNPVSGSTLAGEVIVSIFGTVLVAPMFLLLAVFRRRSPRQVWRDFRDPDQR